MKNKKTNPPITRGSCPICGNTANKTNTHLIPWFIIKYHVTQEGTGTRDKELSFTISPDEFSKIFAGRSVLPEKLEEFGDLHDLEREHRNPYTRDYLWCDRCEEKFSRLEAIFSTRFMEEKIQKLPTNIPMYKDQYIFFDAGFDYSIYQIFIQSIFWRCSVGNFDGFALHPVIENKIKENLTGAFSIPNFNKLKAGNQLPVLYSFPVVTSLLFSKKNEDPTNNLIVVNKANTPYFIMAGKWLFQLFEKEKHIQNTQEWLYGLTRGIDTPKLYPTINCRSHLLLLNESVSNTFTKNRLSHFIEEKKHGLQRNIRKCHIQIFGHKPNAFIQNFIQQQYFLHKESGKSEFESFVQAFDDLKKMG